MGTPSSETPAAVGSQLTRTNALILALAPLAALIAFGLNVQSDASEAKRLATHADNRAAAIEAVLHSKLERSSEQLNALNVKLARVETLVEQLVKDADETRSAVKSIRDGGK